MDQVGNKAAKAEIAMIKIVVPTVTQRVVDMAIQTFGGGGVADTVLAQAYIYARAGRIVDGPDEVHLAQLARLKLKKCANSRAEHTGVSTVRHCYPGGGSSTRCLRRLRLLFTIYDADRKKCDLLVDSGSAPRLEDERTSLRGL